MGLNVSIIRQSFTIAKPMLPDIIASFYEILFREYPEIKAVFAKTEHGMLHKALASALVNVVDNLDKQDKLSSYLMNLGSRHISYGIKPAYFEWFGSSLLKSLAAFYGDEWQGDFCREWSACISMVLEIVRQGAGLSKSERGAVEAPTPLRVASPTSEMKPSAKSESVISPKIETPPLSVGKAMENKSTKTYQVTLTEDVKASIKKAVKHAIDEAIKNEIAKALESELKKHQRIRYIRFLP